jgi:hypothetical protein
MKIRILAFSALILVSCLSPASAWYAEAHADLSILGEAALDFAKSAIIREGGIEPTLADRVRTA